MKGVWAVLLCCQLVLVASAVALDQLQLVEEWRQWKNQHKKHYRTGEEERKRNSVWLANREFVNSHNSNWEAHGYSLSLNQLADLVRNLAEVYVQSHNLQFSLGLVAS